MTVNEEFRVILSPVLDLDRMGGTTRWNVRLQKCPIPEEVGNKGTTTSKLKTADLARLRSASFTPSESQLIEAGRDVWESLMTPELKASFNSCHRQVVEQAHGTLHIIIVTLGPEEEPGGDDPMVSMVDLPFELLRRPETSSLPRFIATFPSSPISRGLSDEATLPTFGVSGPLRVLAVISDPNADLPPIAAAQEEAALRTAMQPQIDAGLIHLEFCEPTLTAVSARMRQAPWHVLHFAGHSGHEIGDDGAPWAYLAFVDPDTLNSPNPKVDKVSPERLVTNLAVANDLRLVVLTSCISAQGVANSSKRGFDSIAHILMTKAQIGAVIAMQFDLETNAAEVFSGVFYKGLVDHPVDCLVTDARRVLIQSAKFGLGHRVWVTPTVLWRSSGGMVFQRTCSIPEDDQNKLNLLKDLILDSRNDLLSLFTAMQSVAADVRRNLSNYQNELETDLIDKMKDQAQLLGEVIRLEPVNASPGQSASCQLILRPRQLTVLQSFRLKVRIPRQDLAYVDWHPANNLPATISIAANRVGDDLQIVCLDTAQPPQPWPPNQDHVLGKVELQVLENRPPSLVDLIFSEDPIFTSPQNTCFSPMGGLVIIEFPIA